jgi:hypothetical protein
MGGGGGGVARAAPSLADEFGADDELGFAAFAELPGSGVAEGLLLHPASVNKHDRARNRAIVVVRMICSFEECANERSARGYSKPQNEEITIKACGANDRNRGRFPVLVLCAVRCARQKVAQKKCDIGGTLGEPAHEIRKPIGAEGNVDAKAKTFTNELFL